VQPKQLIINPSWEQFHLIQKLSRCGRVYFLYEQDRTIDPLLAELMTDKFPPILRFDLSDQTTWPPRGCNFYSCQNDRSLLIESRMEQHYCSIPRTPTYRGILSNNKGLVRRLLTEASVSQPLYLVDPSVSEVEQFLERVGSIVIKPVDSCGSIGVTFLKKNDTDVNTKIKKAFELSLLNSGSSSFIVEQRVYGEHFIVESLGVEPVVVGAKQMSETTGSIADSISFVSPLNPQISLNPIWESVSATHKYLCKVLGYYNGHASGEYIVDENGIVYLVEIAGRGGGVWISSFITNKLTGIDVEDWLINKVVDNSDLSKIFSSRCSGARLEYIGGFDINDASVGVKWGSNFVRVIWQNAFLHEGLCQDARDRIGMKISWID